MPWQPPAALGHRAMRLYLAGRACAYLGQGAYTVAVAALVLDLTGSGAALGGVVFAQFAPSLLLSPMAGVWVDRWPRRAALLCQQGANLVWTLLITLAALGWGEHTPVGLVYALTALIGVGTAISNPLQQALIGELVPDQARPSALALNSAVFQAGGVAGAALAGMALLWVSAAPVLALYPAGLALALALFSRIRPGDLASPAPAARRGSGQLRAGVRYVRSSPQLATALVVSALVGLLGLGALHTGVPVLASRLWAPGPVWEDSLIGWAATAVAAGGVAAQLYIAGARAPRLPTLFAYAAATGVLVGVAALVPVWAGLAAVAGAAAAAYGSQTLGQSVLQRAPEEMKGRVAGLWFWAGSGSRALAGLVVGALIDGWGATLGLVATAGLLLIGTVVAVTVYRRLGCGAPWVCSRPPGAQESR